MHRSAPNQPNSRFNQAPQLTPRIIRLGPLPLHPNFWRLTLRPPRIQNRTGTVKESSPRLPSTDLRNSIISSDHFLNSNFCLSLISDKGHPGTRHRQAHGLTPARRLLPCFLHFHFGQATSTFCSHSLTHPSCPPRPTPARQVANTIIDYSVFDTEIHCLYP